MKTSKIFEVVGGVMLFLGVLLFALSIKVNSGYGFRFYRLGNINLGAVLIVLLIFEIVGYVILFNMKPWCTVFKWVIIFTGIAFGIVFIVSLNFYFRDMSLLQFLIYLLLIAVGTGLLIKGKLLEKK